MPTTLIPHRLRTAIAPTMPRAGDATPIGTNKARVETMSPPHAVSMHVQRAMRPRDHQTKNRSARNASSRSRLH